MAAVVLITGLSGQQVCRRALARSESYFGQYFMVAGSATEYSFRRFAAGLQLASIGIMAGGSPAVFCIGSSLAIIFLVVGPWRAHGCGHAGLSSPLIYVFDPAYSWSRSLRHAIIAGSAAGILRHCLFIAASAVKWFVSPYRFGRRAFAQQALSVYRRLAATVFTCGFTPAAGLVAGCSALVLFLSPASGFLHPSDFLRQLEASCIAHA